MVSASVAVPFVLVMSVSTCWANELIRCRSGQLKDNDICRQCPPHTYMPDDSHTNTACVDCFTEKSIQHKRGMKINNACNSTHQAVVGCIDDYFYRPDIHPITSTGECDRCQNCSDDAERPYEIRKCSGTHDTVCCERPDMVAVRVGDEYQCQGRGAGSTDSKRQGPDTTMRREQGTSTTDVTKNVTTTLLIPSEEEEKMAPWMIALIVVACVGGLVTVGVVVFCIYKKVLKCPHSVCNDGRGNMEMIERNRNGNTQDPSEVERLHT